MRLPLAEFRPRLWHTLRHYDRHQFSADLSAGLTVGIVALPLAMAFAIASGVKPEQGIFTAIIAGFLISALGGSSVQIGGPAGAFIVIVYGIVQRWGLGNLLIATVLAGGLLFVLGLFKLGVLVRYIPVTIVTGFTNGIAVLIALSQLKDLLGLPIRDMPADFFAQLAVLGRHAAQLNPLALALGLACLGIVVAWPKLYALPPALLDGPRGRVIRRLARLPGTIVALALATAATAGLGLPLETIGSRFGGIPQELPTFEVPAFSWEGTQQLFIPTLTIALLGAIESLLCARVADNLTELPRHDPNQELMAQGVANIVAPFFGGIPATGTIARTVTNVRSGARSPVAGMVHALTLLLVVLVAAPLAAHVPLAALAGILMFVAWNMGEWREFARLRRFPVPYRVTLVATFGLTVVFDLTVAVEVGLVLACVFFIYRMGTLFRIEPLAPPPHARDLAGVQVMSLYGSLFFGAVAKVEAAGEQLRPDTRHLVLEMRRLVSMDSTGLDALVQLHRTLRRQGVQLVLCELNEQPREMMARSGFLAELGHDGVAPDLDLALALVATRPAQAA
ncbi:SulP family inorganic anion transporter [Aquabacterium sp. A7-Y]|uniref:SulP family inorganic anion transporter n=1 Tax=Aquabacterium sp. A7-Y TaxID=1349605 RepID=UPI00223DBFEA|nr:SulP family inorganic anion transporter [Aquabacterium sp. A7-Y]MCW7538754.1 SulP family inorganic anion transporter [Aquabacterium sp. A7-Y]